MSRLTKLKKAFALGTSILNNPIHIETQQKARYESQKRPLRDEVINYLLARASSTTSTFLEIGVRNPSDNFDKIIATEKYGVDPGIEFDENPVTFTMTSDEFFTKLNKNEILTANTKFDVIFLDGLHLAEQVARDIKNSLNFLKNDGFLVLHDCNPPTQYHTRENRLDALSPARGAWCGTTWKAFYKTRFNPTLSCCCIDSDWGIGIISKEKYFSALKYDVNPYLEFETLDKHRKEMLNLIDFPTFRKAIES